MNSYKIRAVGVYESWECWNAGMEDKRTVYFEAKSYKEALEEAEKYFKDEFKDCLYWEFY